MSLGGDSTTSGRVRGTYVKGTPIRIGTVLFKPGSAKLTATAKKHLRTWVALVATQGFSEATIDGYAGSKLDGAHGKAHHKKLSSARAKAVKAFLAREIKRRRVKVKIITHALGDSRPVGSGASAKNRRAVILIR